MSDSRRQVEPNDIVQIVPDCKTNPMFGACLMVVTEVYDWGVQGYVQSLGENLKPGGHAYIRLEWGQFEPASMGKAIWIPGEAVEE